MVTANPVALPQAVTQKISPTGAAPPGCKPTLRGSFGIAVSALSQTAAAVKRAESSTLEYESRGLVGGDTNLIIKDVNR